jgi:hypothetical protein
MLKKMSVALLAASILAAPAFAAGPAKKDTSAKSTQTTGSTSGIAKSDASKSAVGTSGDKANDMKPTVGKSKAKPHASLVRHKHHHYAHVRHHNKVKALHASVNNKNKLGFHAAGHKKVSLKRVTPATRRG